MRERILDLAETSVQEKGFNTTSLEEIIAAAGISRNGFFYHFRNKDELAIALMSRQHERNIALMHELFARAEAGFDDPLDVYLEFTRLLLPPLEAHHDAQPGMNASAGSFQDHFSNKIVRDLARKSISDRRDFVLDRLRRTAEEHTLRPGIELTDLANHMIAIIEGTIVITNILHEEAMMRRQLRMHREFVRYAFAPHASPENSD